MSEYEELMYKELQETILRVQELRLELDIQKENSKVKSVGGLIKPNWTNILKAISPEKGEKIDELMEKNKKWLSHFEFDYSLNEIKRNGTFFDLNPKLPQEEKDNLLKELGVDIVDNYKIFFEAGSIFLAKSIEHNIFDENKDSDAMRILVDIPLELLAYMLIDYQPTATLSSTELIEMFDRWINQRYIPFLDECVKEYIPAFQALPKQLGSVVTADLWQGGYGYSSFETDYGRYGIDIKNRASLFLDDYNEFSIRRAIIENKG